jgi:hypothetical protein
MQADNDSFPINAINIQGAKMLDWPKSYEDKIWSSEVVLEKVANGKDILKIIVKASGLRWQAGNTKQDQSSVQQNTQSRPIRSVTPTDQTGPTMVSRSKMLKPKNPEVDEWKVVKAMVKGKNKNFIPIFDYLLSKYVNQMTELIDRSSKGATIPSLKQDRSRSH